MTLRADEIDRLVSFLAHSAGRSRAVVILGEPGIGKSHLAHTVCRRLAEDGRDCAIIDDIDRPGAIDDVVVKICATAHDAEKPGLVLAGRSLDARVRDVLDRSFERRIMRLGAISDEDARRLLDSLGVLPFGMQSSQLVAGSNGNPRVIVDAVYENQPLDWSRDTTWNRYGGRPHLQAWTEAWMACDGDARTMAVAAVEDDDSNDAHALRSAEALLVGEHELAVQHAHRAVVGAHRDGDMWLAHRASIDGAYSRAQLGDTLGLQSLHALAASADSSGFADLAAWAWYRIASFYLDRGNRTLATTACMRALHSADAGGVLTIGMLLRVPFAESRIRDRATGEARAYLEELVESGRERGLGLVFAYASQLLSGLELQAGHVARARMLAEEALAALPESAPAHDRTGVVVIAARTRARCCDPDGALALLGEPATSNEDRDRDPAWALEAVRIVAARQGAAELLDAWFDELRRTAGRVIGNSWHVAAITEARAWLAHARGDAAEAGDMAVEARKLWIEAGSDDELLVTDVLLPAATAVAGSDGHGFDVRLGELLTRREREIASLVARGMTNPETAAELHLSPRTVEHHVASILRKLELPNRRALAQRMRTSA